MPKLIVRPESRQFVGRTFKGALKNLSKAVDTDWFAANIAPSNANSSHIIYISCPTETVVNLQMDDGTNTNTTMVLNTGTALAATCLYAFQIEVPSGYSYNIQHKTGTQLIDCWIIELGVD